MIVNREKNNGEKFTLISAWNELKCRHVGCKLQVPTDPNRVVSNPFTHYQCVGKRTNLH